MNRSVFRLASITIEIVERRKISLEKAFQIALNKFPWPVDREKAFILAWSTLE